jgi:hypothetical protein
MDGADWLRTQLTSFGCAACGMAFAADGIRVLAERDGLFFVNLACDMCGSQATALVTVAADDERGTRADDPELVAAASGRDAAPGTKPVDADDLLDMHQLLAGYQGDMLGLLRRFDGAEGTVQR